jgi:ribosomal protein L12E/L44/L45/RPP1/RPP2
VLHAQRFEDVTIEIVIERLAGEALDDVAREREAVVATAAHAGNSQDERSYGPTERPQCRCGGV